LALDDPEGAVGAFDRARAFGLPWRLLWYRFEPFEAYAEVGRWDDVLALADANLRNASNLEESHYWRGLALATRGDTDAARDAWLRATELNPGFAPPVEALAGLDEGS
jgi:tetratricopeptide (TPR) repeat protein